MTNNDLADIAYKNFLKYMQELVDRITYETLIKENFMPINVKVKQLSPNAKLPVYATPGAACFDLHVYDVKCDGSFGTGLSFEIPEGHVMLVYSRSGHGFKHAVRLVNCVGVIDSDYRGEICVKLAYDNPNAPILGIEEGDRIAQAMVIPVDHVNFEVVDELGSTERGEGGFGSTGS